MTNEKAKQILSDIDKTYRNFTADEYKALEMALKALSQEPTDENIHREREQAYMLGYEDASKRFRQEPCEDAVSRILKRMWNCRGKHTTNIDKVAMKQIIRDELSVTQKSGKWIPVSERLPEDGTYLVTVNRITSLPKVEIDSFAKDLYKVDEFDFCDKKGKCGWYNYDSEYGYWEDEKVIAWMPLPKPFEPQESEE